MAQPNYPQNRDRMTTGLPIELNQMMDPFRQRYENDKRDFGNEAAGDIERQRMAAELIERSTGVNPFASVGGPLEQSMVEGNQKIREIEAGGQAKVQEVLAGNQAGPTPSEAKTNMQIANAEGAEAVSKKLWANKGFGILEQDKRESLQEEGINLDKGKIPWYFEKNQLTRGYRPEPGDKPAKIIPPADTGGEQGEGFLSSWLSGVLGMAPRGPLGPELGPSPIPGAGTGAVAAGPPGGAPAQQAAAPQAFPDRQEGEFKTFPTGKVGRWDGQQWIEWDTSTNKATE